MADTEDICLLALCYSKIKILFKTQERANSEPIHLSKTITQHPQITDKNYQTIWSGEENSTIHQLILLKDILHKLLSPQLTNLDIQIMTTIEIYPFIVRALPHYIRENAHIFANVVQPLKFILSFYKPQIWIYKAQINPKRPYHRLCRNI